MNFAEHKRNRALAGISDNVYHRMVLIEKIRFKKNQIILTKREMFLAGLS